MYKKMGNKSSAATKKVYTSAVVEKRLQQSLLEADLEIDALHWQAAQSILEDLYRRYPDHPEVLGRLLNTSYEIGDTERYQEICEKLLGILPGDVELTLALAGAFMLNSRPALARRTFASVLEKWPEHESAQEVNKSIGEIDRYLTNTAEENNLSFEEAVRLMEMHERMQSMHYQGRNRQAIQLGEQILHEFPDYIPTMNNLSQLHWLVDTRQEALRYTLMVLEKDETNVHARADLVIYRLLTGDLDEAIKNSEMLQVTSASPLPHIHKVIEACSYLGMDDAVVSAYLEASTRSDFERMGHGSALINHLAAVAFMRKGIDEKARKCWDMALEASPTYDNARANRSDLEKPANQRHAPWAFRIAQWLPENTVRDLLQRFDPSMRSKDVFRLQKEARTFLEKNPAIVKLAKYMLELGDESSREFILVLARYSDHPELLEQVRQFALGKRGPDQIRLEAAQILVNSGVMPTGMKKMWIASSWMEILLAGIQIKDVKRYHHSDEMSALLKEAFDQLEKGDGEKAERTLRKALSIEPEAPDALFNLAAAYHQQGKQEQSEALVASIYKDHPNYFFGHTGLAQVLIEKKDFNQAAHVLEPLYQLREMNPSEFDAFCGVNVELQLAEENLPAARAWFGLWESANPENPKLEAYRWRLVEMKD